jgi:hypothetical protein
LTPTRIAATNGTPWYENAWPWFIVILLGTSIVGSLTTVAIAYRHRDVDVRSATFVERDARADAEQADGIAQPDHGTGR